MAATKTSKTKKKLTRNKAKTKPSPKQRLTNAELRQQLAESLKREKATVEVLRLIASAGRNLQPVLEAVAENAASLIGADDAIIHRIEGDVLHDAAHYGHIPRSTDAVSTPVDRKSVAGRAVFDGQIVHVHDMQAQPEAEFPLAKLRAARDGTRSVLGAPLLLDGIPIGAILIRRTKVQP